MRGRPLQTAMVLCAALSALLGCGRTQLSPWAAPFDGGTVIDAPLEAPTDGPPPSDGSMSDAGDGGDAGPAVPFSCGALPGLVAKGPVTSRRTRQALFSADGSTLLLRVAGAGGATSDDLLQVALPSGNVKTVIEAITDAAWLGVPGQKLVVKHPGSGALTAIALDGSFVGLLTGASCEHVIAPDGLRVYALTGCDATTGTVVAIDVATRTGTTLSAGVLRQTLVVSPDSKWVAYQLGAAAGDGGAAATGTVQIFSRDNSGYTLDYRAGTRRLAFTPTNQLIFVTAAGVGTLDPADIYRHVPGSGTTATRVAESRNVGTGGYHVSPDGALLLAARFPPASPMLDELYAVHLDGSGETLVASNLAPYQLNQIGPSVFAFSADGQRAIYTSNNFSGTASVSVAGGMITPLASGGSFGISPAGDRIAVIDRTTTTDTLHLVDAVTNEQKTEFDAATIDALAFVPGAGGLLFVDVPATGPRRLRHFAFGGQAITTLAVWNSSQYWTQHLLNGELPASAGYPTDPTGCYAVVDSDSTTVDSGTTTPAGTSLVLLPK